MTSLLDAAFPGGAIGAAPNQAGFHALLSHLLDNYMVSAFSLGDPAQVPSGFSPELTGPELSKETYTADDIGAGANGKVLVVSAGALIAPLAPQRLRSGLPLRVHWGFERLVNGSIAEPVAVKIVWLDSALARIGTDTVVQSYANPLVADGRQSGKVEITVNGGGGVVEAPASAIWALPYVECSGSSSSTGFDLLACLPTLAEELTSEVIAARDGEASLAARLVKITADILDGAPSEGDTLNKLYNLINQTSYDVINKDFTLEVPGFSRGDADLVAVGTDGVISRIENDDSLCPDGLDVPGFVIGDALKISLGTDKVVSGLQTHTRRAAFGSEFQYGGYIPDQTQDAVSFMGGYDPDKVSIGFLRLGQSKGWKQNSDSGDALISTTVHYPGKCLMPDQGDGVNGIHVDGRRFFGLRDAVEVAWSYKSRLARDTGMCALGNHFIQLTEAATGVQPEVVLGIAAEPAQPIINLDEGSDVGRDIVNWMTDFARAARARGKTPVMPVIFMQHGQNGTDQYQGEGHYIAAMKKLHRWLAALTRSILGQARAPVLAMWQTDADATTNIWNSAYFSSAVARAQEVLARSSPYFTLVGNEGYLPLSSDDLHESCEGAYRSGMAEARTAFGEICGTGRGVISLDPERCRWRSSTILDLEFSVPDDGALELVAGGIVPAHQGDIRILHGIQMKDGGGEIDMTSDVTLAVHAPSAFVEARWLRVTFNTAPVGHLALAIAQRSDSLGLGRTTLGGSVTYAPLDTLPSGLDDRDYAIAQELLLPACL